MQTIEKIKILAKDHFDDAIVDEFINTFQSILADSKVLGSIIQISTDQGEELEIGFFTQNIIADVTLSHGKIYSCTYPLFSVSSLNISDVENKWVLTIHGEKKFDYNIVKPGSVKPLLEYEAKLRQALEQEFVNQSIKAEIN